MLLIIKYTVIEYTTRTCRTVHRNGVQVEASFARRADLTPLLKRGGETVPIDCTFQFAIFFRRDGGEVDKCTKTIILHQSIYGA
jgi:hypothetical protein